MVVWLPTLVHCNVWLHWGQALKEEGNKFVTVPARAGLCISKLQLHFWTATSFLKHFILLKALNIKYYSVCALCNCLFCLCPKSLGTSWDEVQWLGTPSIMEYRTSKNKVSAWKLVLIQFVDLKQFQYSKLNMSTQVCRTGTFLKFHGGIII